MVKHQFMYDGLPVKRTMICTFPGEVNAEREGSTLHIYTENPADGGIYLLASFEGTAYVAESEPEGLSIYHISTENMATETVGDSVVLGAPGKKTAQALSHGRLMTGERLQAAHEAFRRGERAAPIEDRVPSKAEAMQRANELFRKKEWK